MDRYVAFQRGMNIGGRRIKNDELKRSFEELGLEDVSCFRASGNVVFTAADADEEKLAKRIEAGLGEALGYEVPVFLRDAAELGAIAAREPFDPDLVAASKGKLQVAFVFTPPARKERKLVLDLATDEDRLAIERRELYWLPSGGISESDLDLDAIAATIGPMTIRTKGTIDQIAAKHFA